MIVPLFVGSGKRNVAVLTPTQVRAIDDKLNSDYKIRTRFLLQTGLRIAEARYVNLNRDCFRKENGAIFLPKVDGVGKARATIKNRSVLLSPSGIASVEDFFDKNPGLPSYPAMEKAIRLAAREADFDINYITTKMYRKTLLTWLMTCYPEQEAKILYSLGHNSQTSRAHYLAYGFRKDDIADMRKELNGWGDS